MNNGVCDLRPDRRCLVPYHRYMWANEDPDEDPDGGLLSENKSQAILPRLPKGIGMRIWIRPGGRCVSCVPDPPLAKPWRQWSPWDWVLDSHHAGGSGFVLSLDKHKVWWFAYDEPSSEQTWERVGVYADLPDFIEKKLRDAFQEPSQRWVGVLWPAEEYPEFRIEDDERSDPEKAVAFVHAVLNLVDEMMFEGRFQAGSRTPREVFSALARGAVWMGRFNDAELLWEAHDIIDMHTMSWTDINPPAKVVSINRR